MMYDIIWINDIYYKQQNARTRHVPDIRTLSDSKELRTSSASGESIMISSKNKRKQRSKHSIKSKKEGRKEGSKQGRKEGREERRKEEIFYKMCFHTRKECSSGNHTLWKYLPRCFSADGNFPIGNCWKKINKYKIGTMNVTNKKNYSDKK